MARGLRSARGRPKSNQPTLAEKRDRRVFVSLPIDKIDRTASVSVLPLSEKLIVELLTRGFQTVGELAGLTALDAVEIPGMTGWHWRTITTALGRKQFSE